MLYTALTERALAICYEAHAGQLDRGGMPYVFHPYHLAEQMETEEEICAALLHDVVEDTAWTLDDLRREGFPAAVLNAVALLTHDPAVPYMDYVRALRGDPIARRVKLADLAHNGDATRLKNFTQRDARRLQRGRIAQAVLAEDPFDPALNCFRKRIPLEPGRVHFLSVFYRAGGAVVKYSLDVELAADAHFEFGPEEAERLRRALDPSLSLPEALADRAAQWGERCAPPEALLQQHGIRYRSHRFG